MVDKKLIDAALDGEIDFGTVRGVLCMSEVDAHRLMQVAIEAYEASKRMISIECNHD